MTEWTWLVFAVLHCVPAGNPTPFSTHCQNRRLAPGGSSPTFVARGKVRNNLGDGAVGGLSVNFTKV